MRLSNVFAFLGACDACFGICMGAGANLTFQGGVSCCPFPGDTKWEGEHKVN